MADRPTVLLTNDDGIDAAGFGALRTALADVADLRVVAPAEDRSGDGRTDSRSFTVEERADGHAVDGSPADCVQYGLRGLPGDVDLVVGGCNHGPNVGAHKLDRSGTVGAAREAAFLGVPGIAISAYDPVEGGLRSFDRSDFAQAGRVAAFLVETLADESSGRASSGRESTAGASREADGGTDQFDYLNVNAPTVAEDRPLRVTEPVLDYDVRIDRRDEGFAAYDHFYDPLRSDVDVPVTDPVGTDRRALADGEVSVSPLRIPGGTARTDPIATLLSGYETE